MSKGFKYKAEYVILRIISAIIHAVPLWCVYSLIDVLAWVAYRILGIRRKVTLDNLRIAFGDQYSENEIDDIAAQSYRHIGATFAEMAIADRFVTSAHNILLSQDIETIREALERGRGVIFVSSHFGSWEMNGASIASNGFPFYAVAKPQKNPYVDAFINRNREVFGMNIIPTGAAIKNIVRALRNGGTVGLISDQNAGRRGVFVDFFGRKASTRTGAAQLALKYNAPIIAAMTVRTSFGSYRTLLEEVQVRDDDTVISLTQRYTTTMEAIIRKHPEQYFWMHRRWKTRPPEEIAGDDPQAKNAEREVHT